MSKDRRAKLCEQPARSVLVRPLKICMKRALLILLEDGKLIDAGNRWRSPKGRAISELTLYALYDRYLLKVYVESTNRRRHTAVLTDVGRHAAINIRREEIELECARSSRNAPAISEESARFINVVTS